tara:strand:+ start:1111 stop:1278 length:168 start_codon:yes stop_codon:yes gene_type:complete
MSRPKKSTITPLKGFPKWLLLPPPPKKEPRLVELGINSKESYFDVQRARLKMPKI